MIEFHGCNRAHVARYCINSASSFLPLLFSILPSMVPQTCLNQFQFSQAGQYCILSRDVAIIGVTGPSPFPFVIRTFDIIQRVSAMAPARVLHFGPDTLHRAQVLRAAGYEVEQCTTLTDFASALRLGRKAQVICISEEEDCPSEGAIAIAAMYATAPIVLFSASTHHRIQRAWDLEVQPLTHPKVWLADLATLVRMTAATIAAPKDLRRQREQVRDEAAPQQATTQNG
ncbi:hypothetical protein DYQ86_04630 [Acidobacteria bacterium AB60]|nr:hypothetical protein DYQ86_04630 [Acidobacteria bacterium AB60]